jgi:hypothetical protein
LMAERLYDEKQVAQILHQAAQRQAVANPDAASAGLTLEEIQRLAEEVGIDPGLITQAASDVDIQTSPSGSPDRPFSLLLDRAVDGQISEEVWEDLVVQLRHYAGRPGEVKAGSASREWIGRSDAGTLTLMATRSGERTRLRLMANFNNGASAWGVLPMAGFFVGTMAGALTFKAFGAPIGLSVFGTVMTASVLYAAIGVKRWGARRRQEVKVLFDTIALQIERVKPAKAVDAKSEAPAELRIRLGE